MADRTSAIRQMISTWAKVKELFPRMGKQILKQLSNFSKPLRSSGVFFLFFFLSGKKISALRKAGCGSRKAKN